MGPSYVFEQLWLPQYIAPAETAPPSGIPRFRKFFQGNPSSFYVASRRRRARLMVERQIFGGMGGVTLPISAVGAGGGTVSSLLSSRVLIAL